MVEIDARPSDAIALAVRARVPIFIAEAVMDHAAILPETDTQLPEPDEATQEGQDRKRRRGPGHLPRVCGRSGHGELWRLRACPNDEPHQTKLKRGEAIASPLLSLRQNADKSAFNGRQSRYDHTGQTDPFQPGSRRGCPRLALD
ncbi:bifunctional nuclease domain-containing protein [Candidatus Amarobacter glycogenicus]|uniref:bifunctional nuclease domain-containing protein n=1 Tax=Candidatus Amarobacter glycogenicus TaxID=3140699 RepID=UPI0031CC9B8F